MLSFRFNKSYISFKFIYVTQNVDFLKSIMK